MEDETTQTPPALAKLKATLDTKQFRDAINLKTAVNEHQPAVLGFRGPCHRGNYETPRSGSASTGALGITAPQSP